MPYSGSIYTNVAGATTAVPGQIVQSAVWDNIHNDYATALTQVMSQLISQITNRNALYMNGGLEIWQRGAGSSASIAQAASLTAYTADRWYLITGANQASIVAAVAGLTNGSTVAGKVTRNAAQTGITAMTFGYPLDTDEIVRLRGSKISFTCVVKAGANWSPASGTLSVAFYTGTGAVAKRGGGFTNETTVLSISTNLTPGGANTTISGSSTVVVPTNSTQAELQFTWIPVGTAGANDEFSLDDVQIEAQLSSQTWTPTNYDRLDFVTMFQACQRHYAKTFPYSTAPAQSGGVADSVAVIANAVAKTAIWWQYPVRMRVSPSGSVTTYNPSAANANWRNVTSGADIVSSVDSNSLVGDLSIQILSATVTAQDQTVLIHITASAGI